MSTFDKAVAIATELIDGELAEGRTLEQLDLDDIREAVNDELRFFEGDDDAD